MFQNGTKAATYSSLKTRSVFYCPSAPDVTWDLHDTVSTWVFLAITSIASPIIILLNALVIIAVKQRKELQKHSNILLSSLAVADLLVGALAMPLCAINDFLIVGQISVGHVCTLLIVNRDLMACLLLSSLYHLAMVAWERYVAIRKWKDYKVIVTRSCLKKLALTAWLLAVLSTVPVPIIQAIGVEFDVVKIRIMIGNICGEVALIIIVYFYIMVYLGVRKRKTSEIRQVTGVVQAKLESKVAKTTGMITATLILTFLFGSLPLAFGVRFPAFRVNLAFRTSETLVQLNSVINPLLYCYRDRRFRKTVLELLRIRKPEAIQPAIGEVRFRRQQHRCESLVNVQLEVKTEGKRARLKRSASCDSPLDLTNEMMLKRSVSDPSPGKFSSVIDGLQLRQQHSSVLKRTATIHAERSVRYPPRNINRVSPGDDVNKPHGATKLIQISTRSKSWDGNVLDKCSNVQLLSTKGRIVRRPKTAPYSSENIIFPDDTSTISKTEAIQPSIGAVRFRRQQHWSESLANVQLEVKTGEKRFRLKRSASCDSPADLTDEMMLKRSISASALVKFSSVIDGLQLRQQHSSVVMTTATIHADWKGECDIHRGKQILYHPVKM